MDQRSTKDKLGGKPLRILQWNCRSLAQRKAELIQRLKDYAFDVLLLQETRTDDIKLPGLEAHYTPSIKHTAVKKKQKEESGSHQVQAQAGIYIDRKLPHVKIDTDRWCNDTQEIIAVRVALESTPKRLLLVSAYIPPAKAYDLSWIDTLRREYPMDIIIMGGDLNTHIEPWNDQPIDARTKDLFEILDQTDLSIVNDTSKATRYGTTSKQKDSVIDITLMNTIAANKAEWSILEQTWGSDHFPIIVELDIDVKKKKTLKDKVEL